MTTRTFKITYEPDPETDQVIAEILEQMPEVVEVGRCKWERDIERQIMFPLCRGSKILQYTDAKHFIYCPFCGAKIERI